MADQEAGAGQSAPSDTSGGSRPSEDDASGQGERNDDEAPGNGDLEAYEVFVQWQRGRPHEHAETVTASDADLALLLAKRNVDVRSEPVSLMVVASSATRRTSPEDTTLVPTTDRSYRTVEGYAATDGEDE